MSAEAAMLARVSEQTTRAAQAERDCVDLHAALAEALKRIQLANVSLDVHRQPPIAYRDLLSVLERTARPEDGHGC